MNRTITTTFAMLLLAGCGSADRVEPAAHGEHAHPAVEASHEDHAAHANHAAHADHAAHGSTVQPAAAPTLPPGDSLFHLDPELALIDQLETPFTLAQLGGRPALITFFYGGCTTMCPLIVSDVHRTVDALPEAERGALTVVLVTIDPERDTPARLRGLAEERGMPSSWRLVSGSPADVRTLASTLGMTYREMPDGSFAHAALYTVVDREGRIAHQAEGVGRPIEETAAALRRQIANDPS